MSKNTVTNYRTNETAMLNGKAVTILSSHNDYVTVRDNETGREFFVSKSELSKTSIYTFSNPIYQEQQEQALRNQEQRKKIKAEIQQLVEQGHQLEAQQKALLKEKSYYTNWVNNFLRNCGVPSRFLLNEEQRNEFDPNFDKKRYCSAEAVSLGNSAISCFNSATRIAHSMKWLG